MPLGWSSCLPLNQLPTMKTSRNVACASYRQCGVGWMLRFLFMRTRLNFAIPSILCCGASPGWYGRNDKARTHDEARSMVAQRRSPEASLADEAGRTALFKCRHLESRWVRAAFVCGADPGLAVPWGIMPGFFSPVLCIIGAKRISSFKARSRESSAAISFPGEWPNKCMIRWSSFG